MKLFLKHHKWACSDAQDWIKTLKGGHSFESQVLTVWNSCTVPVWLRYWMFKLDQMGIRARADRIMLRWGYPYSAFSPVSYPEVCDAIREKIGIKVEGTVVIFFLKRTTRMKPTII